MTNPAGSLKSRLNQSIIMWLTIPKKNKLGITIYNGLSFILSQMKRLIETATEKVIECITVRCAMPGIIKSKSGSVAANIDRINIGKYFIRSGKHSARMLMPARECATGDAIGTVPVLNEAHPIAFSVVGKSPLSKLCFYDYFIPLTLPLLAVAFT
jgi:hypothetical protein